LVSPKIGQFDLTATFWSLYAKFANSLTVCTLYASIINLALRLGLIIL